MNTSQNNSVKVIKNIMNALEDVSTLKHFFKRLSFIWRTHFSNCKVEYYLEDCLFNEVYTPGAPIFGLDKPAILQESARLFGKKYIIVEKGEVYILLSSKVSVLGFIRIAKLQGKIEVEELIKLEILANFIRTAFRGVFSDEVSGNEVNYGLIVERSADIIYSCDYRGTFTYINPIGVKLSGFSIEEIIGSSFLDFIPSTHRGKVRDFYNNQFTRLLSNTYYEYPVETKAGNVLWLGQNVQIITTKKRLVVRFHAVARVI
jgi:PAS domain S-box-containing protein